MSEPMPNQNPQNPPAPPTPPKEPQTFSLEYVKELRDEAKNTRIARQSLEDSVRTALDISKEEPLDNVAERIAGIKTGVNNRIIQSALQHLPGYNTKLLARLADLSKVTVADDGTVKGLKEAAEAVAKEFPAVKNNAEPPPAKPIAPFNPAPGEPPPGSDPVNRAMNDLIRGKK